MKKVGLVILGLIILSIISGVVYVKYQEYAIEKELNGFSAPSSWRLISEQKASAIPACGNKNGCPSITRYWKLDRVYASSELSSLFRSAQIPVEFYEECNSKTLSTGSDPIPICNGSANTDSYHYTLFESVDSRDQSQAYLTIYVNAIK